MVEKTILIDTREQQPFNFGQIPVFVKTLKTGDYSILGFENEISIERKSIPDLVQTLTRGHQRFKKEIQRSMQMNYFAILIEGSAYGLLTNQWQGSQHTKVSGQTIFKILCTIHHKYKIPFFFAERHIAPSLINTLFDSYLNSKNSIKKES